MTKLTYKSAADLIADFKAGAKFEVMDGAKRKPVAKIEGDGGRYFRVFTSEHDHYGCFRPDGSNEMGHQWNLVKIADAPATIGKGGVFPLPFKTVQEIAEAFTRGAKFVVEEGGSQRKVTSLVKRSAVTIQVYTEGGRDLIAFRANGDHPLGFKLIMTAAPSPTLADQLKARMGASVVESAKAGLKALEETFLKRVLAGEHFHVPATREVFHSVDFRAGRLDMWLVDEQGDMRRSENYNHEGKHKWVAGRSLVAGPLPKKPAPERKQVNVDIYRHAFNGSLFVIREGEVVPNIRGISNATKVGSTVIAEPQK